MKFCTKKYTIINNHTSSNDLERVGSTTEYEALRAEKLFRYEYSNQLNTGLLTFAFTIFTAGLALFALIFEFSDLFKAISSTVESTDLENLSTEISIKNLYSVFVEYFFACFFLLPCFFARVNFRYTVKNSLRIGQLTDYIREKVHFDDGESWESFKRDYKINYFYRSPSGVGGAKDIPKWINIISHTISLIVGMVGIYVLFQSNSILQDLIKYLIFYAAIRMLISILCKIYSAYTTRQIKKKYYFVIFSINRVLDIVFGLIIRLQLQNEPELIKKLIPYTLIILIWAELLQFCVYITPQYDREIHLANSVLEYTKAALIYSEKHSLHSELEADRYKHVFEIFLKESSVLKKYDEKYCCNHKKIVKKCMPIYAQVAVDNKHLDFISKNKYLIDYLKERDIK
ncbi:MAG: hypothetical protein E7603_00395 [Ruminococcaceae bacterium]|nr:hypothetical protein [Oscillospiraceae bacterium]